MNDTRGFTLLELLMVVIIIAILASIALPQYLRTTERARASEAMTVLGAIRTSEMRYKAFNNKYNDFPTAPYALDIDVPGYGAAPLSTIWTYSVPTTGGGTNGIATRIGGKSTIELDLDGGVSCSADTVYGFGLAAC